MMAASEETPFEETQIEAMDIEAPAAQMQKDEDVQQDEDVQHEMEKDMPSQPEGAGMQAEGEGEKAEEVTAWEKYACSGGSPGGGWMRQCSKHLSHIEKRLMEGEYLGHEVVRQVGQLLEQFSPPPLVGIGAGC